jgi:hypothetical protein
MLAPAELHRAAKKPMRRSADIFFSSKKLTLSPFATLDHRTSNCLGEHFGNQIGIVDARVVSVTSLFQYIRGLIQQMNILIS